MKKLLQILGGAVVAASVIPYAYSKDEESGEKKVQALFWKANLRSQTEEGEKKLTVTFGFNNPFQTAPAEEIPSEEDLFADEELVASCQCECEPPCGETNECCDASCSCEAAEKTAEVVNEAAEEAAGEITEACCEEPPCCPACCDSCCDESVQEADPNAEDQI